MKKNTHQLNTAEHIENAAFELWKVKGIQNTSISEICKSAHIGRSTFYRYYGSEKDIVLSYVLKFVTAYNAPAAKESRTNKELTRMFLLRLKQYSDKIHILATSGYKSLMAEVLWPGIEPVGARLSTSSSSEYTMYFSFGAFTFVFLAWSEGNDDQDAEKVSLFLCEAFGVDPDEERSEEEIRLFLDKAKQAASLSNRLIIKADEKTS